MTFVAQLIDGKSLLIQDDNNAIVIGAADGDRFKSLFKIMSAMKRDAGEEA